MYKRTDWKNHVVDPPHRFTMTDAGGGNYDFTRVGTVMEQGTPQDKDHFNNLEHGVEDAIITANLTLLMLQKLQEDVKVEATTVSLTNTDKYPFNNSTKTVALAELRNNTDYSVEAEVLSRTGPVQGVKVFDKLLNGFKVKFEGSGTAATVRLRITGGLT